MILNGRKIPARQIVLSFKHGASVSYLAEQFRLSEPEIQEVIRRWMKIKKHEYK